MGRTASQWLGGFAVGWIVALGATPAAAIDIQGTWAGSYSCKVLIDGDKASYKESPALLFIAQSGSAVDVLLVDGGDFGYKGKVVERNGHPNEGAVTVVECRTAAGSNEFNEMISAAIKLTPKAGDPAAATFKGTSTYASDTLGDPDEVHVGGVCKFSFKRIDDAPLTFDACSPPI